MKNCIGIRDSNSLNLVFLILMSPVVYFLSFTASWSKQEYMNDMIMSTTKTASITESPVTMVLFLFLRQFLSASFIITSS